MALTRPRPRGVHSAYDNQAAHARATAEAVYRAESRRVFATLIRLLGDFDLAEEALADRSAPRSSSGRARACPRTRGLARVGRPLQGDRQHPPARAVRSFSTTAEQVEAIPDDALQLDNEDRGRSAAPAHLLPSGAVPDAQVALTLREVCDLTTEEIALAFLSTAPTLAQRIVRAKTKIRDARIPYQVPTPAELPERLDSVLRVVYLVFNRPMASSGDSLTRVDLSSEAIRLDGCWSSCCRSRRRSDCSR